MSQQQQQPGTPPVQNGTGDDPQILDPKTGKPLADKPADPPADPPADTPNDPPADQNDPPADPGEPGEEDPIEFWNTVDNLWGRKIEVEFPEDVDPVSPQGAFLREKAVWDAAQEDFEETIKKTDTEAYQFMLHKRLGGTNEEFFSTNVQALPDKELLKTDVNLQRTVIRQDLIHKGVEKDYVEAIVAKMETDGVLQQKATAAYDEREAANKKMIEDSEKKLLESSRKTQEKVMEISNSLQKTVTEDLKFVVPETKQSEFMDFVTSAVRLDEDGEFVVTLPIKTEKMKTLLQALYLVQSGGDLTETIKKQANHQQTLRLKQKSQQQSASGSNGGSNTPVRKSLTEVWK